MKAFLAMQQRLTICSYDFNCKLADCRFTRNCDKRQQERFLTILGPPIYCLYLTQRLVFQGNRFRPSVRGSLKRTSVIRRLLSEIWQKERFSPRNRVFSTLVICTRLSTYLAVRDAESAELARLLGLARQGNLQAETSIY